jgi:maleate isomerase
VTVRLPNLPFQTDGGAGSRARLGLIALATDYTVEQDYARVLARVPDVALYVSRIPMAEETSAENLAAMGGDIEATAGLLLPGEPFAAIAYGCSSATSILGEARVERLVQAAKPGAKVTNPITAARAALTAFGARRIGILTPYVAEVNAQIEATFRNVGFEVSVFGSFDEPTESRVGKTSTASILNAVRQVAEVGEMDAIFVSCTNLRALEIIEDLEHATDLPVTSSNHAMIWHQLRLAGIEDGLDGLGRLFDTQI